MLIKGALRGFPALGQDGFQAISSVLIKGAELMLHLIWQLWDGRGTSFLCHGGNLLFFFILP